MKRLTNLRKFEHFYPDIDHANSMKPTPMGEEGGREFPQTRSAMGAGNTMEFTHDQYEECCSAVEEWSRENDKPVRWSFLPGRGTSNRRYWDMYVREGDTFTLVMSPEKLIGVVTRNGKIKFAYDNMDRDAG